ncbi:RWD domain-containing protein 1-like [Tubulanus polymorphus]|uniref:RWD domain-containing protein 1-like n=1 Tax=Tubulanus polymorphus TaxID=672921 RepID=UPI003DA61303
MTDYKEDQVGEIEALESIYVSELTILETEPFHSFEIKVTTQEGNNEDEITAFVVLEFTYTEKYPEEPPEMSISSFESLEQEDIDIISQTMKEEAEENVGMVMVFTIVSAVQEKLHVLVEEAKKRQEEKEDKRKKELEEAERKKFEGTIVTIETFLAWKSKFDAEMQERRRLEGIEEKVTKKLTGRQLFMQDHTLDDSDVKFLQESGGAVVEVDESLFQDMEDLDLDAELDDEQ